MRSRHMLPGFSARLIELRNRDGLTQQDLADRSGTNVYSISKMERGLREPSLWLAEKLAAALGVSVDDLLKPFGSECAV